MKKDKLNLRNVIAVAICLAVVTMFSACDKEKPEYNECYLFAKSDEFCLYVTIENFYKTAPFINSYLRHLSKNNWSYEQQVQALIDWLTAKTCIINAELESLHVVNPSDWPRTAIPPPKPGTYATIAILLNDNDITRELWLEIWKNENNPFIATRYYFFYGVSVNTHWGASANQVFDFINMFDHRVPRISHKTFNSTAPIDRFNEIINSLERKPYIEAPVTWWVNSAIQGRLITPVFLNMENKDYQADWIKSMNDYQLVERENNYRILFLVPPGTEREWLAKFEAHEFIDWGGLVYEHRSMLIE